MNKDLIKEGLKITKTILFRVLIIHAGSFLRKPGRVWQLTKDAVDRVRSYETVGQFTEDIAEKVRLLSRMTRAYVRGDYNGIERTQVLMVIGTLLYFLMPIDIIPDTIPLIGYLDDLSLISWLAFTISEEMSEFREWEAEQETGRKKDEPPSPEASADSGRPE